MRHERYVHRLKLRATEVPILADHVRSIDALDNTREVTTEVVRHGLGTSGRNSIVCKPGSDTLLQGLGAIKTGERRCGVSQQVQRHSKQSN
jgi:hypothetical protein